MGKARGPGKGGASRREPGVESWVTPPGVIYTGYRATRAAPPGVAAVQRELIEAGFTTSGRITSRARGGYVITGTWAPDGVDRYENPAAGARYGGVHVTVRADGSISTVTSPGHIMVRTPDGSAAAVVRPITTREGLTNALRAAREAIAAARRRPRRG